MGSNAQRKSSSRSLNFDGYGGAGSKSMKRQKLAGSPGAASWDSAEAGELEPKNKKRFVGVRQRPSGRWVAEIKDTTQKIRLWLGTFDSAEEGAKAYDSAARALRGANTRTNFVTAISCEGAVPATTSKAARLIRLRQIAAANAKLEAEQKLGHGIDHVISPLLRQDSNQQSINSDLDRHPSSEDERHSQVTTPPRLISSFPLKPARQIGRRHNSSPLLSSAKLEQEAGSVPLPVSAEDNGPKLDSFEIRTSSLKLAPQQSAITPENLSNAIHRSLIASASPQDTHFSSHSTRLPLENCNQPNSPTASTSADEEVPLVHNPEKLATTDNTHPKCKAVDDGSEKHRLDSSPLENSRFSSFTVEKNLIASPPKQQRFSCCTSRADASLHATSESDGDDNEQPTLTGIASCKDDAEISFCLHSRESSGEASTSTSLELGSSDTIPWSDYVLVDGLDLTSCETNCGVYASVFDFSAEAMDRDSCASSVLLEDISDVDSTEFLLTMPDSDPQLPAPLSPPETSHAAQSSGSTDSMDVDAHGECSSPEEPLWRDLTPLRMRTAS
ncbi:hypothetical protein M758_5G067100 [Ceratodon purpureus]|nr:hypothetical protein M758_5G067100 [Ceratodon purpureus]